jgi:hypothetical protein
MGSFHRYLAAAIVVAFVLPIVAIAEDKQKEDSEEQNSKEMELKACGPKDKAVKYSVDTDKSKHPTPEQPTDKALIYVLRPAMMGMAIQTKLAVDGDWKGVNRANNYFFFTLEPGEHYFCSEAENHSLMKLKVEAGKTYYVQQHVRMGMMKARNKIEPMTEEEGKAKLATANLSTWQVK